MQVQDLRQMHRVAAWAEMGDLGAAGESVADDYRVRVGRADGRQQHPLADRA